MTSAAAARSQKFDTTRFGRTRLGGAARGRWFLGGGARPRRCFWRRTRERGAGRGGTAADDNKAGGGEQANDEKRRPPDFGGRLRRGYIMSWGFGSAKPGGGGGKNTAPLGLHEGL